MLNKKIKFIPINIAVLTISDTRKLQDDKSGRVLVEKLRKAGHNLKDRKIIKDNVKGITIFDSPVPANPTFIFAGVAAIKKAILNKQLKDFVARNAIDSNFEVDFFQFMIDQNLAKYQIYSGKWKTIDSIKDFLQYL